MLKCIRVSWGCVPFSVAGKISPIPMSCINNRCSLKIIQSYLQRGSIAKRLNRKDGPHHGSICALREGVYFFAKKRGGELFHGSKRGNLRRIIVGGLFRLSKGVQLAKSWVALFAGCKRGVRFSMSCERGDPTNPIIDLQFKFFFHEKVISFKVADLIHTAQVSVRKCDAIL